MARFDPTLASRLSEGLVCRALETPDEIDQVQALLYRTFVEEIPHHAPSPDRRLVDRFHEENQYFGCLRDGLLLGSIAYRDRRPFSLDQKLPDLDAMIPQGRRWCEVRLLAVAPDARHTHVSALLLSCLVHHALAHGRDAGLLSGTTLQLPFYRHLGCQPFGPLVGREGALFQPMWILLETFMKRVGKVLKIPDASRAPIRTP